MTIEEILKTEAALEILGIKRHSSGGGGSGIRTINGEMPDGMGNFNLVTSTNEVDPIFNAWDKSTGILIYESQILDLKAYLTDISGQDLNTADNTNSAFITLADIPAIPDVLTEGLDYLNKIHLDLNYLGLTAKAADSDKLDGHDTAYFQVAGSYLVAADISGKEDTSNKSTNVITDAASDTKYPSVKAVKTYTDGLTTGFLNDRGGYDASVNSWPTTGGSGTAGAIMKGDLWFVTVAGTLGVAVAIGASFRALVDTPGQTAGNWNILDAGIGYTPENVSNKVTSINGSSTDTQYPSAKLLYDQLTLKQDSGSFLTSETDPLSLHLDQTTHQHIINGQPVFDEGLIGGHSGFGNLYTIDAIVDPVSGKTFNTVLASLEESTGTDATALSSAAFYYIKEHGVSAPRVFKSVAEIADDNANNFPTYVITPIFGTTLFKGSGLAAGAAGGSFEVQHLGAGTLTFAYGISGSGLMNNASGTIGTWYGVRGMRATVTAGAVTNNYAGGFGGNVLIGQTLGDGKIWFSSSMTATPDTNLYRSAANILKTDDAFVALSINELTLTKLATGFTIAGGTTSKTLTVPNTASVSGNNTGDQDISAGNIRTILGITTLSGSNTGDETISTIKTKLGITTLSGANTGDNATNSQYSGLAASKQDALVSATNIKTINGSSILGAGDLKIVSSGGPKASAYHSVAQNNINNAWVQVTLGTENYDIGSNFASSTFTVPVSGDGYYLVDAQIAWTGLNTGRSNVMKIGIYIDAALSCINSGITSQSSFYLNINKQLYLTAGQTVSLYQYHDDATNVPDIPIQADSVTNTTYLDIHLLST